MKNLISILLLLTLAACSNTQRQPNNTQPQVYDAKFYSNLNYAEEFNLRNQSQVFLKSFRDLNVCFDNSKQTTAIVSNSYQIDYKHSRLGHVFDIEFINQKPQKKSFFPIFKKKNNPKKLSEVINQKELKNLKFEIVYTEVQDDPSIEAIIKHYPLFLPPKGLDCISCHNEGLAHIVMHPSNDSKNAYYLTEHSGRQLTFKSETETIILVPNTEKCPK